MADRGNEPLWLLKGESYPNEKKLHEFCFTADETDENKRLFYAGFPSIGIPNVDIQINFRTLIKHSSLISFSFYLLSLICAESELTAVNGISDLGSIDLKLIGGTLVYVSALIIAFAWLIPSKDDSKIKNLKNISIPILFYSGLLFLAVGAIGAIILVVTGNVSEPNIIFVSGYFLLLYITGPIVYDGILRTENLFNNLSELDIIVMGNSSSDGSPDDGISAKQFHRPYLISFIALWFMAPFAYIWYSGNGPFSTGSTFITVLTVVFDAVIAALAIYFLLINRVLYLLLTDSEQSPISLEYDPSHSDLTAGYRDLGRFASRVNLLLILSVLYLIYRLYVQGRLFFLLRGTSFSLGKVTLTWVMSYLIPALVFLLIAFVWFYSTFWLMHRAMERERENWLRSISRDKYENIMSARDAPVWPVDQRFIVAILSADVVSLVIALSTLFAS